MLVTLALAFAVSLTAGTAPGTYSERWLCDLWAGAQCHATACTPDGKARCEAVSRQCQGTSRTVTVSPDRSGAKAACAKALLAQTCGSPHPEACQGLM